MRDQLIANALKRRLEELCDERLKVIAPEAFGADADFVARVLEHLRLKRSEDQPERGSDDTWMTSNLDCLSALRVLSLGEDLHLKPSAPPPTDSFLRELDINRREPALRFRLLTERYACPLNFALPPEADIREHVLTQLMVRDRGKVEQHSVTSEKSDDLLLQLNLLAVHARLSSDLRFLDALNYYYELLPADWKPHTQHNWLLVSYLALYAHALAAWLSRDK